MNVNFAERHNRKKDTLQIRYSENSDLAKALRQQFYTSYHYLLNVRSLRTKEDRSRIRLPEDYKEYLAIYTTEYEDTYLLEAIISDDIVAFKEIVQGKQERVLEASFNYDVLDNNATLVELDRSVKIRKLNRRIGDNFGIDNTDGDAWVEEFKSLWMCKKWLLRLYEIE